MTAGIFTTKATNYLLRSKYSHEYIHTMMLIKRGRVIIDGFGIMIKVVNADTDRRWTGTVGDTTYRALSTRNMIYVDRTSAVRIGPKGEQHLAGALENLGEEFECRHEEIIDRDLARFTGEPGIKAKPLVDTTPESASLLVESAVPTESGDIDVVGTDHDCSGQSVGMIVTNRETQRLLGFVNDDPDRGLFMAYGQALDLAEVLVRCDNGYTRAYDLRTPGPRGEIEYGVAQDMIDAKLWFDTQGHLRFAGGLARYADRIVAALVETYRSIDVEAKKITTVDGGDYVGCCERCNRGDTVRTSYAFVLEEMVWHGAWHRSQDTRKRNMKNYW